MFDIIGDIHGYSDQLLVLLRKLGYRMEGGAFCHPARTVLFLGDYINKGPKIKATLKIVKAMSDKGSAIALMGNHEFNAIWDLFRLEDESLPADHSFQWEDSLLAFDNNWQEFKYYVDWFKNLPLFYENDYFRAVHACWDSGHIALLREKLAGKALTGELITKTPECNRALAETLNGKELALPINLSIQDGNLAEVSRIRYKWWEDPAQMSYKDFSVDPVDLPDLALDLSLINDRQYYGGGEKPVFFGHYGRAGFSSIIRHNVCCLDFGMANGGYLAAYRMDQSMNLSNGKLVYV
ncbi:Calcineurin-like phosphoesterase [Cyclobacterium lianum]|uniref:Calcineurin-like phosphoesterase n=1 Tax=Cyclobacterium lianum TaxID=388280 RepID=A0A1M7Q1B2_9BACT|nr:metallophosphoesterase [Cyclobacterium lianum]SHN23965.1 Calcineurin-like phosphoesterase [Cyclobacterium lianum]